MSSSSRPPSQQPEVDVPSVASVEVLLKTTTEEEMLAFATDVLRKQAPISEPQAPINPFLAPSAQELAPSPEATTTAPSNTKSRQSHVFLDANGKEKKFGSALGLLTARFIDMLLSSESGTLEMNESAEILGVPKRRIYDITNVLEGVGMLEKRSKNTVAWKGSEAILSDTIDPDAKQKLDDLRAAVAECNKEDAKLEQWCSIICKLAPTACSKPVWVNDILDALFYSRNDIPPEACNKQVLTDEAGKPRESLLAIHAPYESVAQILPPSAADGPERELFVGNHAGLEKFGITTATENADHYQAENNGNSRKRKLNLSSCYGFRPSRHDDKIEVYVIPTYFDDNEQRLRSHGLQRLVGEPEQQQQQLAGEQQQQQLEPEQQKQQHDHNHQQHGQDHHQQLHPEEAVEATEPSEEAQRIAATTEPTKLDQIPSVKRSTSWDVDDTNVSEFFGGV